MILQRTLIAFVTFILITGSTSSTYGAKRERCSAAPPTSAADALKAKPGNPENPIHYREDVFHPALNDPVSSRGWFEVGQNGSLVRRQSEPEVETTKIGKRFITIRRSDENGGSNIILIPPKLNKLLKIVRRIIGPNGAEVNAPLALPLELSPMGWSLELLGGQSSSRDQNITIGGCGDVINYIELRFISGERRTITFEPPK